MRPVQQEDESITCGIHVNRWIIHIVRENPWDPSEEAKSKDCEPDTP